ncbi:MAG: hypothetical protein IH589_09120 [Anaerolineales bacterium]|nr:hypothetical protein [Anaerolineales bacterium]
MPVSYNISSELNIIIYICKGLVTGSDLFNTAGIIFKDKRYKYGMVLLIDLLSATLDFELQDLRRVITETNATKEKGLEPEQIIILSRSTGIHLACKTLNLMSSKDAIKLSAFHTLEQALISLDLTMDQQEIIQFWHESKAVGQ